MTSEKQLINGYNSTDLLESVRESYNSFADHWNKSRQHNWYEFPLSIKQIKSGNSILDIGCGNGRFLGFIEEQQLNVNYQGIDNSKELILIAKENYPNGHFEVGDALALPYDDESFDHVVSFAVLHHITPASNRQRFFAEIARVLQPGGTAFISVWNLHQQKYRNYFYQHLGAKLFQTLLSPFNTSFGLRDCLIPFGEEKILRYVHGFTPRELQKLASAHLKVVDAYYTLKDRMTDDWKECRNMCVCVENN